MTAPVFRSVSNTAYANVSSPLNIAKPTGTVDNDIMLAFGIILRPTGSPGEVQAAPAGWTAVSTETVSTLGGFDFGFRVWWKRASAEGASYNFTQPTGGTRFQQIAIVSYSGCIVSGSPIDAFSTNTTGSGTGTTATALSVTTTIADAMLVVIGHNWDAAGATAPTGMTERFDNVVTASDGAQTAAGASGDKTYLSGSSGSPWQSWMVALKPVPVVLVNKTITVSAPGSYAITGTAVTMRRLINRRLAVPTGLYDFTGTAPTLFKSHQVLGTATGFYAFTGTAATLTKGTVITYGAVPSFRSVTSVAYGSRADTTLAAPAGLADDDILIAVIALGNSGSDGGGATPPAGFTALRASTTATSASFYINFQIFWKRAASESGSYTFTHPTRSAEGTLLAYSGVLASGTPIDSSISVAVGTGATSTVASITTTKDNTLLVVAGQNWDAGGSTAPTGFAERFDHLNTVYDAGQATAGASGAKTHTPNGTTAGEAWQSWLFALKPTIQPPKSLIPFSGSYAFTGTNSVLRKGNQRTIAIASSYQFAGLPPALNKVVGGIRVIPSGSYTFTGTPPLLRWNRKPVAAVGSYTFTGTSVIAKRIAGSPPSFNALASTPYAPNPDSITVAKPIGTIDNDIMLAITFTGSASGAPIEYTAPDGWAAITGSTFVVSGGFAGWFRVFWKRAASEGASYTFTHTGFTQNDQIVIASYSGCIADADPIDAFSQNAGTSNLASGLSVTTTIANSRLICAGHNWDNAGLATPFAGATERFDGLVTLSDGVQVDAGPTGAKAYQSGTIGGNPWQNWMIALIRFAGTPNTYLTEPSSGSYSFTGTPPPLRKNAKFTPAVSTGEYNITGSLATFFKTAGGINSFTLVAPDNSYAFEGATVVVGKGLIPLSGSYAFDGAATLRATRKMFAPTDGSYRFYGSTSAIYRSPNIGVLPTGNRMTASVGSVSFILSYGLTPVVGEGLITSIGSYSVTGSVINDVHVVGSGMTARVGSVTPIAIVPVPVAVGQMLAWVGTVEVRYGANVSVNGLLINAVMGRAYCTAWGPEPDDQPNNWTLVTGHG